MRQAIRPTTRSTIPIVSMARLLSRGEKRPIPALIVPSGGKPHKSAFGPSFQTPLFLDTQDRQGVGGSLPAGWGIPDPSRGWGRPAGRGVLPAERGRLPRVAPGRADPA